ncbi:hypothetical protein [Cellulomonas sp. NPDC089187]|uniref:hypothetical protein n=1 Tax=Cellulomonas sp. NPDC089187 TaxID=3154970 RepID=UPI0034185748
MALPTAEQRLAARRELQQWSNARADARRGRPLQPGDISRVKGRIPTITTLVRSADERKDDIR